MKLYIINLGNKIKYIRMVVVIVIITIAISSICDLSSEIQSVFSEKREIPIYCVESKFPDVAITFDCAWGGDDIPDILDTLKKENILATFFIVGEWAEKFPESVSLIAKHGHDIANHSYSHLRMGQIGAQKIQSEISKCGSVLSEISGNKIDLFRPPYGDYNDSVIREATQLGYYTIQWDVDSLDWKPGITKDEILNRITVRVKNGSIILFHNDTPFTAQILPKIISTLKSKNYTFKPVSQMILRENYYINFDGMQKKKD